MVDENKTADNVENDISKQPSFIDYMSKVIAAEKLVNANYTVKAGSSVGDNFVGVVHRVLITGERLDGEKYTTSLIYKRQPDSEARRIQFRTEIFFRNEAVFYNHIASSFLQFQKTKSLPDGAEFKAMPLKCYHAGDVLIIEDMCPYGFTMKDRKITLGVDSCRLVMRELGKLHAFSFAFRDQKPEEFERLASLAKETVFIPPEEQPMVGHFNQAYAKAAEKFKERANIPNKASYLKKIDTISNIFYEAIVDVVDSKNAEPYAVINHGDCWTNNILFKHAENSSIPEEICLIDFQLTRYSSPATDLSYFFFCCTGKDMRDEHYDSLVKEYYNSLSVLLTQLGSDPEILFPFSALQDQLKRFSLYGLGMAVMTIPLFTCDSQDVPDFNELCDNAKEENKGNIMAFDNTNDDVCWERMNGVFINVIDKGYL